MGCVFAIVVSSDPGRAAQFVGQPARGYEPADFTATADDLCSTDQQGGGPEYSSWFPSLEST